MLKTQILYLVYWSEAETHENIINYATRGLAKMLKHDEVNFFVESYYGCKCLLQIPKSLISVKFLHCNHKI